MSELEKLCDLLFEVSNEDRLRILLQLDKEAMRVTSISRELGISIQETSRHISRLGEAGLTKKDVDGFHHLTSYGELVLKQLRELEFTTKHRGYLTAHSLTGIPTEYVKRIGDLADNTYIDDMMGFFHCIERIIREAEEYVWLQVDQYPLVTLASIIEALKRGVRFRVIEHKEMVFGPHLGLDSQEEIQALTRTRYTPLVEQKTLDEITVFLFLSEKRSALAFLTHDGRFDYRGFTTTDERSLKWCGDLFQHDWERAEPRVYISPIESVRRAPRRAPTEEPLGRIVVEGRNDSLVDAHAVQDAVDNFDEVILRGTFNFGSSSVQISRSVLVRGEGRENDIPTTTIYKKGWRFPFTEWDCVLKVDGEGADITIENIQFTDFNHTCIWGVRCNSLNIKNNRITLMTGYGRGMRFGAFGDVVIGINVWPEPGIFKGRVTIEGNYLDFARRGAWGGFLSRGGLEEESEYRPDLFNHEYYMGFGVAVQQASGNVSIENNIIRNANARGIAATGNLPSADVQIRHNTIVSDLYGSYPFSSPEAGAGILAQSAWGFPSPGFNVEIEDNTIKLDKLNYSGIKVLGPVIDREGADKLRGGIIRNNRIQLKDGYEGIHVRKCDDFEVADNKISGEAYYGIRISGRRRSGELNLRALNNLVEGNDMDDLRIREPDEYSDNHSDGRMFAGSPGGSATAHVWLGKFSKNNTVKVKINETVINEGEENTIIYEDDSE